MSKKEVVLKKTNDRCGYCGCPLTLSQVSVGHIISKNKGGDNLIENLIAACRSCNGSKGDRTLAEYRLWVRWQDICREQSFSVYQLIWLIENTDFTDRFPRDDVEFYFETMGWI
ncbi:HNH endonuclease [Marinomonas sp.]|uniref:HNH endonuclease n=1 Tax=Marinomonas sp. TaxID=1904862 RepID=UPI003BA853DE